MNTMINISDLPTSIKNNYDKWVAMTGINSLDAYFEDFTLNIDELQSIKYLTTELYLNETDYDVVYINIENNKKSVAIFKKDSDYTYFFIEKFMKQVNELYEDIRN